MDALNLPALTVQSVIDDALDYLITAQPAPAAACSHCGTVGELVGFGRRPQTFADLPMHGKQVKIQIPRRRWRCGACERISLDPLPAMDERRKMTRRLVAWVVEQGRCRRFTEVAREAGLTEGTVRAICREAGIRGGVLQRR